MYHTPVGKASFMLNNVDSIFSVTGSVEPSKCDLPHHKHSKKQAMSKFESVNVIKAANVYFDGEVSSRTVEFSDGTKKTLGLMLPGEYKFDTDKAELMEITAGKVSYCLAGEETWNQVEAGGSFNVPGNSSFQIKAEEITDYVCSFLD